MSEKTPESPWSALSKAPIPGGDILVVRACASCKQGSTIEKARRTVSAVSVAPASTRSRLGQTCRRDSDRDGRDSRPVLNARLTTSFGLTTATLAKAEQTELVELRRENTRLRMERELLKRAVAFWVTESNE